MNRVSGVFFVALAVLVQLSASPQLAEADPMFAFQLPWDDSSATVTDLSYLNHKPAGVLGPVRVGSDGHLYTGSQRIRFIGVNFTYRSAFPEHPEAVKIARRLAKFGVNIVRFHHMDAEWGGQVIFDPAIPGTRDLDPAALDRLDFFISELKKNGIYSNLNLVVARNFRAVDVGNTADIEQMEWKEKQTPAMFDPALIALQKEYAAQLLDRVNPYTGLSYKEDPAIAMVEVINEHGLMHAWHSGMVDDLPPFYYQQLRGNWNQYLGQVYANHSELMQDWAITSPPGGELLRNRDFTSGLSYWNLEQHQGATATATVQAGVAPGGKPAVRIQITHLAAQNWHIQFNQSGLSVTTNQVYTLKFKARADRTKSIVVAIGQAHDPWQGLGFSKNIDLTTSWKDFEIPLTLAGSDSNARLNFSNMGDQLATYWLADLSLAPGGTLGVFPDENLDTGNMRLFLLNEAGQRTDVAKHQWAEFLWKTEEAYWLTMRHHLKEELRSRALFVGTIVGTSTPNLMSLFDIVDGHAYWQHPSFEVSWGSPWWIRNSSMVGESDGGTVSGLSIKRVEGKPFSVTEYNHAFPLSFSSETFYFLSIWGALQDWDAIFGYTYADGSLNWGENKQTGHFDLHHDPGKMASLVQAAHIFRRGDLSAAEKLVTVSLTAEQEVALLPNVGAWRLVDGEHVGLNRRISLIHRTSVAVGTTPKPPSSLNPADVVLPADNHFVSDTGQVDWDTAGRFLEVISTKTRGILGYVFGREFDLGGFQVQPVSSLQNWAAIFVSDAGGPTPTGSRHLLLSAQGLIRNTGMTWAHYPSNQAAGFPPPADVNLTLGTWGSGPVEVEGIECEFRLPYDAGHVQVFALDSTGARRAALPITSVGGKARFLISPAYQTLWYEIVLAPMEVSRLIPGFEFGTTDYLGVGVSNPSDQPALVRLAAYPESGSSNPFPWNPVEELLEPRTQLARLGDQIFGAPSQVPARGWIEISSNNPSVGVFIQSGDYRLRRLDGVTALPSASQHIYLTSVYEGEGQFRGQSAQTILNIANPGEQKLDLELTAVDRRLQNGEDATAGASSIVTLSLEPRGMIRAPFQELFDTTAFQGHLEIRTLSSAGALASAEVSLLNGHSRFALNATSSGASSQLFSAQLAHIPDFFFTEVTLLNTSNQTRELQLTAVGEDGQPISETVQTQLQPGESISEDAADLFGNGGSPGSSQAFVGSLKVVADGPGIVGDVTFGLNNLDYAAALLLQDQAFLKAVFSHVANLPGTFFTGLALLNPGTQTSQATIRVFSPEGQLTGELEKELCSGCRISEVLDGLIPSTKGQVGGYLWLSATQPLIAQELFGTTSLSLLSAVPPTVLE